MKAIKSCLKNLFVNIKYYFVPLGISMFFFIIGVSVGFPTVIASIKTTFNGIAGEIGSASFDWTAALNKIFEKVVAVDQSQGLNSVLATISSKEWLLSSLTDVAKALFGDSVDAESITKLIADCANTIVGAFTYIVIMFAIGFVVSFFVIMVVVRKTMTKTGWIRSILTSIVDTALFAGFIFLYSKLRLSDTWVTVLVLLGYSILFIFISFVEAYLFYGVKKLKFREVLNFKNVIFLLIGNILTLLIGSALIVLTIAIIPWYGGIILAIPFVEIVFLVMHMNADGYIEELVLAKNKPAKVKEAK